MSQPYKKKLIEVAIPLEAINAASAREKSIRHGHPSTLHLWWARRPLAACRAVLFAQLVDDPCSHPDKFPTEEAVETERKRLFSIIEELVKWENSTNEEVLEKARTEIRNSCDGKLPPVYDPFSGGGSIPLEAQRLGLPAFGSDLNPVAVLIGKAMMELPQKFKDCFPIHPEINERSFYRNAEGLAEDVKYYSERVRIIAKEKLGRLYPEVNLPVEYGGGKTTALAWIWARTVPSPDPAFADKHVPLVSNFLLNSKNGQETWLEPNIDKIGKTIAYSVKTSTSKSDIEKAKLGTKSGRGANFVCLFSNAAITSNYVKSMAKNGLMGQTLLATVVSIGRQRRFVPPSLDQESAALNVEVDWKPDLELPHHPQYIGVRGYGLETFGDLFTNRQAAGLGGLNSALTEVKDEITRDCKTNGHFSDAQSEEYVNAVITYLAFGISKLADMQNTSVSWKASMVQPIHLFTRHAIPMIWDFAEPNLFSGMAGDYGVTMGNIVRVINNLGFGQPGLISNIAAQDVTLKNNVVFSSDPPYYDNVPYADVSDFFYVWLKRSLKEIYPNLFATIAVPKFDELVADRVRHGSATNADLFFLNGMLHVLKKMNASSYANVPATIYYAFKQSEIQQEGTSSTGWVTFLNAVISAGYSIQATWPVRTELANRIRGIGSNALANSVVLVCRKREVAADSITRGEFIRALRHELPPAIKELQIANVSPADMPQSAIGPGIGVFSRYRAVLEADDNPMSVKTALQLINAQLDEFLNDLHGDFDPETRFTATWFEQNGFQNGDFGPADNLARARGISVESVKHAGIIESSANKVRILKRDELDPVWDPNSDTHLTIWECCQHLVREYEENGEMSAAILIKKMGFDKAETVKDLAYYLYDVCSNKRQDAREATSYNGLIAVWSDLTRLASSIHDTDTNRQAAMDF